MPTIAWKGTSFPSSPTADDIFYKTNAYGTNQGAWYQYDGAAWVPINVPTSALGDVSHNLIRNYPSLESADGSAPLWWSTSNLTLTEEDATGESLSGTIINERILKGVTTAAGGYLYQRFTLSDEPLLDNQKYISTRVWVYVVTAGTVTLEVYDSSSGVLGTDATTTTGSWVKLEVSNEQISAAGTYVDFRVKHSANTATFYIANPVLNTGDFTIPWHPRGLREKYSNASLYGPADLGGSVITVDCTSDLGNLAVALQVRGGYYNTTTVNTTMNTRYYGSSNWINWLVARDTVARYFRGNKKQLLDDQQRFELDTTAGAGDTEQAFVSVDEIYYVWE